MRTARRLAMATIVCTLGLGAAAPSSFAALFFGYQGSNVGRVDADGTDQTTALFSGGQAVDVATTSTHVYWTRPGFIGRARLDGSQVDTSFAVTGAPLGGLGLDATHVYWANEDAGTIGRASLADGAVDGAWSITGAGAPMDVAVGGGFVYWTDISTGRIGRAPIANPAGWSHITGVVGAKFGITVDDTHIYYAGADMVARANLDGSGAAQFVPLSEDAFGVAVDDQYLYAVEFHTSRLYRVNVADGSNLTMLATLPFGGWGVAIGPEVGRLTLGSAPSFGDTVQGATSATADVTVTNSGEAALTVDGVTLSGAGAGQFEITAETCTGAPLPVDDSCSVTLRFAPTSAGAKSASLEVASADADGSPRTRALSATGLGLPAVTMGSAPTFPNTLAGAAGPTQAVTITNSGGSPLTVASATLTGSDSDAFEIVSETCTDAPVAASGTCEVALRFAPATAGAKSATLSLASDAPSSPDTLGLSATALARVEPVDPGPAPEPDDGGDPPPACTPRLQIERLAMGRRHGRLVMWAPQALRDRGLELRESRTRRVLARLHPGADGKVDRTFRLRASDSGRVVIFADGRRRTAALKVDRALSRLAVARSRNGEVRVRGTIPARGAYRALIQTRTCHGDWKTVERTVVRRGRLRAAVKARAADEQLRVVVPLRGDGGWYSIPFGLTPD